MADVAPYAERGQLILVTALSLAILFVTLALILNTAIYTENLATRSGDIGGGTDAVRYHDAARDGVSGVIDYANGHNNSSHSTLQSNLSAGVDDFQNHTGRLFATGDRSVETTLEATVKGTRIAQSDPDRNFTNASFEPTWTLVENVEHTRSVEINVTNDTPLEGAGTGSEFQIEFENGTHSWRLNVTSGGTVGITNGSGGEFTCTESTTPVIDVTGGTVDGEPCEGLDLAEGVAPPYNVSIDNGDNIEGTYSMVVDNESLAKNVASNVHLVAHGSGQPFAVHAVYSANVTVVYQTPRLYYNTTVRVAPGEPDG